MTLNLSFFGAAGTVTGSCYLLEAGKARILIDCGLFQGDKTLRELNYGALPFAPQSLQAVLLTHAHIDHSGQVPRLAKGGYAGPVYTTAGSADLLRWMLPDSAMIQEMEVERLNRRNQRRGRDAVQPIYTAEDAARSLKLIRTRELNTWFEVAPGVRARFWPAGHILGAVSIELECGGRRLLFSGDVGPEHKALQPPAEAPHDLDYLIMEGTYGGRERPKLDASARRAVLAEEVRAALKAGGNLLIPAFAVERTQELLADLCELQTGGQVPKVPIFVDSPLATKVTEVFDKYRDSLALTGNGHNPFQHAGLRFLESAAESRTLETVTSGAIIIAASGMCDAGRIRHHLQNHLWRNNATVLIIGYQAPGTLGALLLEGKQRVRIHGEEISVKARIRSLEIYSGHADHTELLDWLLERLPVKAGLFLTHGEAASLGALQLAISAWPMPRPHVFLPQLDETWSLEGKKPRRLPASRPPRLDAENRAAALAGHDWHNDYAALVLDLQNRLRDAHDPRERRLLLRKMRRQLGA